MEKREDDAATPSLLPLHGGGWLAYSPPGATFRIGVTGQSEAEAVAAFAETWAHWRALLTTDLPQTVADA